MTIISTSFSSGRASPVRGPPVLPLKGSWEEQQVPQENCAYRWNTHCEEELSLPQAHWEDGQEEDFALHCAITNNRLFSVGMVSSVIYKLPRLLVFCCHSLAHAD